MSNINMDKIWENYKEEIYFFALKQLKDRDAADEVLQNSFLKIHLYLDSLKEQEKVKAWIFQIVRNEIINYVNHNSKHTRTQQLEQPTEEMVYQDICCLDRFVEQLPETYRKTIKLLYFKGKKQHEVAEILGITLANVKARTRRGKSILKHKLQECCQYEVNKDGKLIGEADCFCCQ